MREEIATDTQGGDIEADETTAARNEGEAMAQGEGPATEEAVLEALKNVYDPELGLNIVDLGLVYEVELDEQGGVDIRYSLTTMGCPIGPMIEDQMRAFLKGVPGVGEVRPEFVMRPRGRPR